MDESDSTIPPMESQTQITTSAPAASNSIEQLSNVIELDYDTPGDTALEVKNQDSCLFKDEMKFMKDFDPTQRLAKKKMIKFSESGARVEKCDCLRPNCTGCHFPCSTCNSGFCGHECRVGRSWDYDEIEVQGGSVEVKLRRK